MPNNQGIWSIDERIPSDASAGLRIIQDLLEQLQNRGWSQHDVFGVHLATEEALVNAVKHGNQYDPEKTVRIQCNVSPESIRIEITDQGDGFTPESIPDPTLEENLERPCGRGVLLIHKFMDEVSYNSKGNHLTMERRRTAESQPDA